MTTHIIEVPQCGTDEAYTITVETFWKKIKISEIKVERFSHITMALKSITGVWIESIAANEKHPIEYSVVISLEQISHVYTVRSLDSALRLYHIISDFL